MEKLVTITTLKQLEELKTVITEAEYIAFDTETDGVDKEAHIIGFSIAVDDITGYYVVLSYWDVEEKKLKDFETTQGAKAFLELLPGKSLIMQNGVFDCSMVWNNYQVSLIESLHTDTMILGHLLDENRSNGLKELAVALYGEDSRAEQVAMKASVHKNGGVLTKKVYELYKADWQLLAKYGAKDAILTMKVFYTLVPPLFDEKLDKFFYDDESMPLFTGPTYEMNTTGLAVDPVKLDTLKKTLEVECMEAKAFIHNEIWEDVKEKYPGTGKTNHFNINATQQLSWLLFENLGILFNTLTKAGRTMCKALDMKVPYTNSAKRQWIQTIKERKGEIWVKETYNKRTDKTTRAKKIGDPWIYMSCGKESLMKLSPKMKWVARLLEYKKNEKLLKTYVVGIQDRMKYNIIRPNFLQHGTTSGRYSCKNPNFQNLPRDDKRVKACIVPRKGKIFVGADYAQLEPRVFASFSGDRRLLDCFKNKEDFYSVIGAEAFGKKGCSLKKDDPKSFATLYPELRHASKVFSLAAVYGTGAFKMAPGMEKDSDEVQEIIDSYFRNFPDVYNYMLSKQEEVKNTGKIYNLFGRPRRIPKAMAIPEIFGKSVKHSDLSYEWRTLLNLAVNHPIQSTGASIMNRAAISLWKAIKAKGWTDVKIVLQVHDSLILEGPIAKKDEMMSLLKHHMETTSKLPGVDLIAEPKAGYSLAEV